MKGSPAVSHLMVVMVGGGNYQPCPFCWRLGSWSHSCRVEGGREGFGIVSVGVSMVTDCCRQPTRLGPLSVLSPGETMG